MREVCVAVCLFLSLVEVHPLTEYPYISFMGQNLTNHSYVDLTLVGTDTGNTVWCHTDLHTHCTNVQNNHRGNWYFPNGTRLQFIASGHALYESRIAQQVDLHQRNSPSSSPSGIYHCNFITDGNDSRAVSRVVYLGLYASGGDVSIVSGVSVSMNTLTCISTGGPTTTVTWTRDSTVVTEGAHMTVLDDPVTAQYTHTLTVTEAGRQGGLYTCTMANNKPSTASASITVQVSLPPTDVSVVQDGPNSVKLSWTPSSNAIGYVIDYTSSCGGNNQLLLDGGSTDECRVTGLEDGGVYTISIVAILDGFPSESVTKIITLMGVNSENLQVTMKTDSSIHLSWTGAEAVGYYLVEWKTASIGGCSCRSDQGGIRIDSSSTAYDITGLEEHSRYIINLKTLNSDGSPREDHSFITAMTLEAAPSSPPSSVSVSEVTSSSITVQWGPVDCLHRNGDITGYSVQYESLTVSLSGDSSGGMYVISGLMPSTNYSMEVAAKTNAGTGPYSTAVDQLTSSEFSHFLSATTKATSISFSWTRAGSDHVSYVVTWYTDDIGGCSGVKYMNSTTINDCSTIDIMGLEEDTLYTINVTASNTTDTHSITATTSKAALFAAPISVSVSKVTSSSIIVQWGPVDCIHRNGDITGYSVQYGSKTVSVSGDSSGGMYVISDLMPSTSYSVKVAAETSFGTGPYSTAIYQQTAVGAVVFVDDTIMITATSISLSWPSAGSEDVSYEVTWQTDDQGRCSGLAHMNSTITTEVHRDIFGLEEDTSYTISVTAFNSAGSSAASATLFKITSEAAPSAPPSNVSVSEVNSSSITVQWGPVDCIHRNGNITGYSVQYGSKTVSVSGDSSGGMHVISGLMPSTTYSIQVAANTRADTGPYSTASYQLTAVAALLVVDATMITATTVSLSWTSAGTENVSYEVMWVTDDIGGCSGVNNMNSTTTTEQVYNIFRLEEDSSYSFHVRAYNSAGSSVVSDPVSTKTLEAAPSAPPSSVNVSEVTSSSITVQWGPVDCIHRNGDITGYSVQYKEVESGSIHNMTVSGSNNIITEATIINLMPSTTYIVQVAAINDAGDGVYSDPLTASTNHSTEHSTATVYAASTSAGTGTNSETMTTDTPNECKNGGNQSPVYNMVGVAMIIIGTLFLVIAIAILLITVLIIRSVRVKTNIMPPPTSKRRSERDEKESKNMGGVYARKTKRCPDSIPTANNEAYNVVKLSREAECTEAVYETVFTARSVPPSTSQPTIDAEYELI